jgi:hypothetical protein
MTSRGKFINKFLSGNSDQNIAFDELVNLLESLSFEKRITGSHHIFYKEGIEEIINIQPTKNNKAKAYQVKQVRNLIVKHKLKWD